MSEKTYRINEIFYSTQGEGARVGTANLFLRFSGCNLECSLEPGDRSPGGFVCDTEFTSGRAMTAPEIIAELKATAPNCEWVICTGGEPLLQLDAELIRALCMAEYKIALETNGTRKVPDESSIAWISVSPKVAEHALQIERAEELRYVRAYGQGIPKPKITADHHFISPAFDQDGRLDRRTLDWCIRLVLENPEWRLSLQTHKLIGVR